MFRWCWIMVTVVSSESQCTCTNVLILHTNWVLVTDIFCLSEEPISFQNDLLFVLIMVIVYFSRRYVTHTLLFISYKFVKGFMAITFLLLLISRWKFNDVCQRLLCNQKRNFSWIRQKIRNMTLPKWVIFTMGVYGEILCLMLDPAEISFLGI